MKWLEEIIDMVNAGGISGEWATQSQVAASSAVDKLELPAIPDDALVDLIGCLIDEVERLTRERDALLACRRGDLASGRRGGAGGHRPAIPGDAVEHRFGPPKTGCIAANGPGVSSDELRPGPGWLVVLLGRRPLAGLPGLPWLSQPVEEEAAPVCGKDVSVGS